jgi:uncharacterized protein (TIGR02246 family)
MNMLARALVATSVASLLIGCGGERAPTARAAEAAPEGSAVDVEAEARAIRARSESWYAAAQSGDTIGVVNVYADDAVILEPNVADPIRGREAIRRHYANYLATPDLDTSGAPTEIVVARSGELAYETGEYRYAGGGPDGRYEDEGRWMAIWEKHDGDWRIIREMSHSKLPERAGQPASN